MKQMMFSFILFALLLYSCSNKQQSVSIDNLIVGKWKMVEYAGGRVNTLDTILFMRMTKWIIHLKQANLHIV